ncbi:exonuclease SbcCD subunit D [Streptomyces sp. SID3343]|uniref:metallophosphoesterase family protein n=1 Tax=Streptomyces sp. SID3343 TaxID=2690260 RepID=UPI00136EE59A|nr:exonuclease SbcCD subunit D [Streptomyces sp. SID3343]MYW01904.1 exonuclease subunit SbcD [Streptomyces sp. SID3343]
MRLVHTSDWHLGRTTYRQSRDGDFEAVLAEIVKVARDAQPDLIVHSGDLFDTYRPAVRDQMLAMRTLGELQAVAPTVVLAGNHDSPALFAFLDFMSASGARPGEKRLTFVGAPPGADRTGVLDVETRAGDQRIRLATLPFIHANRFLDLSPEPGTAHADYATGLRRVQDALLAELHAGYEPDRDVLVFAAHLFVAGATPSYSERALDITDTYATDPGHLPAVAYGALGHIHKPQAVSGTRFAARYAGSPLQLDFGETGETKSVVIVDADPGRPTRVDLKRLRSGRRLAEFTGTLAELKLRAAKFTGTLLKVTIVSESPVPQLARAVAAAVPGATVVDVVGDCAAERVTPLGRDTAEVAEPELADSFRDYLSAAGTPGHVADDVLAGFTALLATLDDEAPPPCAAQDLLESALRDPWTHDHTRIHDHPHGEPA